MIEGVSCAGKTTICDELQYRGYHAIHGDRELAYQGDPKTGIPTATTTHEHHIWDVDKVKEIVANKNYEVTFFCGGSRNFYKFIDLFDNVFVLDIDLDTLNYRLNQRPKDEWGSKEEEKALVRKLHSSKEDIPKNAILIDATAPVKDVVDQIISLIK